MPKRDAPCGRCAKTRQSLEDSASPGTAWGRVESHGNHPMNTHRTVALVAGLLVAGVAGAQEKLPPNSKLVGIEARPASVTLRTPFEYSQLLLTGRLEGGEQLDVTRMVAVKPPPVVK